MRSAIIHDWLLSSVGGGEKVLEAIDRLFPSTIYTLLKDEAKLKGTYFEHKNVISSFIQKLPRSKTKYKSYLPLFPLAIEQFDLKNYEVVISSSHCVAKGVLSSPDQLHICYCHTPMRYAWDLMHEYLAEARLNRGVKGFFAKYFLHYLRGWDVHSSHRVDHFVANSRYVARRIEKFYSKKASVIYPGVDLSKVALKEKKDTYYLTASRLVPYKRIDLIVEAFSSMPKRRLVVIGDGPEMTKIKKKAGKNVEILGYQPDSVLKEYMQNAKGFVFAAVEDFGIVPVEAMASGTPVIAYGKGGVLETVIDGKTGHFYSEQSAQKIQEAIEQFEKMEFDPHALALRAKDFSLERFNDQFETFVREKYESNRTCWR